MKKFLSLALISLSLLFASCKSTPNCTMQQMSNGQYKMINDNCNNCSAINVIGLDGSMRSIGLNEASQMMMTPQAYGAVQSGYNYNSGGPSTLQTLLLYNLLFRNQQYSSNSGFYNRYNRYYDSYTRSPQFENSVNYKPKNNSIESISKYKASAGFSKPSINTSSTYKPSNGFKQATISESKPSNSNYYKPSSGFSKPSSSYRPSSGFSSGSSSSYRSSSGFSRPSSSSYSSSRGFSRK